MPRKPSAETRKMVCPYCGYCCETGSIGAVHCGPHKMGDGTYREAVQMVELGDQGEGVSE